jgi:3-phosphoglycerate kinase
MGFSFCARIMSNMKFLSKLQKLPGKTCLLRVDFNVEGVKDALRLEASLPTMKFLLKKGARIVILSHRGRPEGMNYKLSLREFIPFLKKNLKQQINFLETIPPALSPGKVLLLENLRFWPEEEANDLEFAKKLAKLGDFYVNDAFAVSHRENASVTQLPKLLPSYAGMLLEKEIKTLSEVVKKPKKPLVLIFGGSKVEDKASVIKHLLPKADVVLLGSSAVNNSEMIPKSPKIRKPLDWIGEGGKAFDIGPMTVEAYAKEIKKAKTLIWNGPVGWFEKPEYLGGSKAIAKAVAQSKAVSIIGGGETTQLILELGLRKKIGFLSTGGGAMLEFLAGKKLPGIEALK